METYINAQGLDPMFMIVEQSDKNLFNRGKLLNIGYLETIGRGGDPTRTFLEALF